MTNATPRNKTERLLKSFQLVELLPEHRNYGNQGPTLRDYGIAGSVATALIRWGETEELVCTFENEDGKGPNAYSWMPEFIKAAAKKHVELYGEAGRKDLPPAMLDLINDWPATAGWFSGGGRRSSIGHHGQKACPR